MASISSKSGSSGGYYGESSSGGTYPEVEEKRLGAIRPKTETGEEFYPENYEDLYRMYPSYVEYINELRNRFYSPRLIYRFILRGEAERGRLGGVSRAARPVDEEVFRATPSTPTPTMTPFGGTILGLRPGGAVTGEEAMNILAEKKQQDKLRQEEFIRQAAISARNADAIYRGVKPSDLAKELAKKLDEEKKPEEAPAPAQPEINPTIKKNNENIANAEAEIVIFTERIKTLNGIADGTIRGSSIPQGYRKLSISQIRKQADTEFDNRNKLYEKISKWNKENSEIIKKSASNAAAALRATATEEERKEIAELETWIKENASSSDPQTLILVGEVSAVFGSRRKSGQTTRTIIDATRAKIEGEQAVKEKQAADRKAEIDAKIARAEADEAEARTYKEQGKRQDAITKIGAMIAGLEAFFTSIGGGFDDQGNVVIPAQATPEAQASMDKLKGKYIAYKGLLEFYKNQPSSGSPTGGKKYATEEELAKAVMNGEITESEADEYAASAGWQ